MCFSLGWIEQLFIWLIIVGAIIAIVRLLLPMVLGPLGGPAAIIIQIMNIVMWAVVACFIVYIIFDLLSCLGGFHLGVGR